MRKSAPHTKYLSASWNGSVKIAFHTGVWYTGVIALRYADVTVKETGSNV